MQDNHNNNPLIAFYTKVQNMGEYKSGICEVSYTKQNIDELCASLSGQGYCPKAIEEVINIANCSLEERIAEQLG